MTQNKRTIPELRVRILELADIHNIPELREIEAEMYRNSPARRSPPVSRTFTAAMANQIRDYATLNPRMSFHEIAAHFDVNPGRVSEAMNNLL